MPIDHIWEFPRNGGDVLGVPGVRIMAFCGRGTRSHIPTEDLQFRASGSLCGLPLGVAEYKGCVCVCVLSQGSSKWAPQLRETTIQMPFGAFARTPNR